ncbi:MAG: hypothetical protein GWP08_08355 [Nitrospiraceae bacterium]|nr:hypothetical protein [Nitrospiraceae bacterium]
MIVQCCLCKKVRRGKRWEKPHARELDDKHVSHGYCPVCADKAFTEMRGLICATKTA